MSDPGVNDVEQSLERGVSAEVDSTSQKAQLTFIPCTKVVPSGAQTVILMTSPSTHPLG